MPLNFKTQSQKEYVDIRVDKVPTIYHHSIEKGQVNGGYQSLVYDVPFDHSHEYGQQKWLESTHMAALLVGLLFLITSRNRRNSF